MGRASSSKKVARAARAGGTPAQSGRSWLFPAALAGVLVLGVALVVVSRGSGGSAAALPPRLGDHYHAAFGVWDCGRWLPPLVDTQGNALGIHSHADGLIHVHPTSSAATGEEGTLGVFADEVALELSANGFAVPGGPERQEGDDCDGEPGEVYALEWEGPDDPDPTVIEGDPRDIHVQEGDVIAVVFGPEGAEAGQPPSVRILVEQYLPPGFGQDTPTPGAPGEEGGGDRPDGP